MNKLWKRIGIIIVCIFAAIGFALVAGYIAVELGWTNTKGIIDTQHDYFQNQGSAGSQGANINYALTSAMNGSISGDASDGAWSQGEEWQILSAAIVKDKDVIDRVAKVTGVPARMIVAPLVVEQLRLFYSERDIFKQAFAPLKILGNQSQFSWGVMGIKQDTARQIENNLASTTLPWYLGAAFQHMLDYLAASTTDQDDAARFSRLTNPVDRYYSYLYGALNIKEVETQWQNAGFPINDRPDIVATLFNIGFENSHPHAGPQAGGAEIDIASTTYSFGSLAGQFYKSDQLTDVFPK